MEPQQVGVKLLPHRNEAGHNSYTDLAAENTDKVHESRECGGIGGARQGARFEPLQNDAAHQADVGARESGREKKLHYRKLFPAHEVSRCAQIQQPTATIVSPTARISREFV